MKHSLKPIGKNNDKIQSTISKQSVENGVEKPNEHCGKKWLSIIRLITT